MLPGKIQTKYLRRENQMMYVSLLASKNVYYIIFYKNLAPEMIHYQKLAKIVGEVS